ncbi:hypothetical protein [Azospirillum sp. INR13]|uniref:hypothetical protein n=1 Tax=Azospirillum sp. INR13 TaxID=2596919 RepID=UPI0019D5FB69|nr:hypothetical protein [Azospirillum sp. INR13]
MSSFATFLADRVESYIALSRSLGYAFRKSSAILRALARYGADEDLDGPLTQDMAVGFVLSWDGTATVEPFVTGLSVAFAIIWQSTTGAPKRSIPAPFPGPAPSRRHAS